MKDEEKNKIIKSVSNYLDKINTDTFLNQIQNVKEEKEYLEISKQFCTSISDVKKSILEELNSIGKSKMELNSSVKTLNNDMNSLSNNLKSILNQTKFKLKSLLSNTNDLNSNLNLISGNLEKKKYSLASSRVEKLFQLKNTIVINVKSLETFHQKIVDELKNEKKENKKMYNLKSRRENTPNKSTTPSRIVGKSNDTKILSIKKINLSKKKLNSKRDLSVNQASHKNRTTSYNMKNYNTIHNERGTSKKQKDNYIKENEDLKKRLLIQKQINERLTKEIEKNKRKSSRSKPSSSKIIINKDITNNRSNLRNISFDFNQNILKFIEKINKISDTMVSFTVSINTLQNKNDNTLSTEPEFLSIKKNLLNVTTEISELKSDLLKISLDRDNTNGISRILEPDEDPSNQIDDLKKENLNLQISIDSFKSQIMTLTQKLSNKEQGNKDELDLKDTSTLSNSEISSLKEQLRLSEKKYLELKGMYDSNIESKKLIENLLNKNLEETKSTYEQKINKLKKK